MRAARLSRSPRLQAVLEILSERGRIGATTREIQLETGSVAVHSDVAELRANGLTVCCSYDGLSERGRRVYRYAIAAPGVA
jgi:hypothetical protein